MKVISDYSLEMHISRVKDRALKVLPWQHGKVHFSITFFLKARESSLIREPMLLESIIKSTFRVLNVLRKDGQNE